MGATATHRIACENRSGGRDSNNDSCCRCLNHLTVELVEVKWRIRMGIAVGTAIRREKGKPKMKPTQHQRPIIYLMHCNTHRYTHSNPPFDLDQLGGQVVRIPPERPVICSQAIGQSTEHSVLITSRNGQTPNRTDVSSTPYAARFETQLICLMEEQTLHDWYPA